MEKFFGSKCGCSKSKRPIGGRCLSNKFGIPSGQGMKFFVNLSTNKFFK